jgi:MFS family permease
LASRLPREAKLFGAVSLLNDFASEMVYPLLPALLTGLGAGPLALGALDGAADFASAVVKVGAGRLADRPRRRGPLVVFGYLLAVVVRPVIAVATAATQVIMLRVVDRLGKGLRGPARDALIADATPPPLRGRAFGLQRGLDHLGAVLGPLAAWALLTAGALDVAGVIVASIVPGVLVLVLTMLAVRRAGGPAVGPVPSPASPRSSGSLTLPRPIALVAASHLVRLPDALLLLHVQRLGVPVAAVTLLWAAVHVAKSGASFRGGSLSDRLGAGRVLALGWAAYGVLAAGLAFAATPWQGWVLFIGLSAVVGLTEGPERALVAHLGGGRSGSAFGAYYGAQGFAALAGGLGLGLLYQTAGPLVAILTSAAGVIALRAAWRPDAK